MRRSARRTTAPVEQGNVGGGTGMVCHEFKGGIGTASRVVAAEAGGWTVGVLVQANYGERDQLRIDGVPVGVGDPGLRRCRSPYDPAAVADEAHAAADAGTAAATPPSRGRARSS